MKLWQSVKRLLDPAASSFHETFSMGNRGEKPEAEKEPVYLKNAQMTAENVMTHIDSVLEASPKGKKALEKAGDLSDSLEENVRRLKALFRMPPNKDLIIREFLVSTQPPTKAVVCFMEGISDKTIINDNILQPLMLLSHLDHHVDGEGESGKTTFSIQTVLQRLLPGHQTSEKYTMATIAESLLAGDSLLLFEGAAAAIAVETKSPPTRSVGEPKSEQVVWGPHDAFNEAWRVNVALVRRRLKDPRVVTEILTVGEVSRTYIGMMYIDGIASPKLIAEAKRRIEAIKVDTLQGAGMLEQYIEDSPSAMLPALLTTERPDRTAGYLAEGHVALFVDTSPQALILPATFWSFLQTAEDYYLRHPFGSLLRFIRLGALIFAMLVPSIYIAVLNYHQEMLPTEFMLFVASTRETVPMPAVVELLLMDFAFELIREAGVRIPGVIGPTMGLVASLILGQAAVEAKIVSPLMIIVVALTGLASFAIPNYLAGYGIRWMRFALLAGAATLGFFGLASVIFVMVIYAAGKRSFGVAWLSPIAPASGGVKDVVVRPPLYDMEMRPSYLHPLNERRQDELVRSWDPYSKRKANQHPENGSDEGGQ